ncbi:MAG: MBL fold metallo-hydrolase [Euryarchaeota archaeon]|nr:MBL fold metallo-hydrolase [Euryarchaeota archaeon]
MHSDKGLSLWPLASGSNGNALLVSSGTTTILIDDGISTKRLSASLGSAGKSLNDIAAVFITHEHHDHVSGLPVLRKRTPSPFHASAGTAGALPHEFDIKRVAPGKTIDVGNLRIEPFRTPHDAEESFGYLIEDKEGKKALVATDVGHVNGHLLERLEGCGIVMIEANHDLEMLMDGRYPEMLKERIRGPLGHLSNDEAADVALEATKKGAKHVILAHMSADNNHPELALSTVMRTLKAAGQEKVMVKAAPRGMPGEKIALE